MSSFATSINMTKTSDSSLGTNGTVSDRPVNFEIWYRIKDDDTTTINAISTTCNITTVTLKVQGNCTIQGCQAKYVTDIPQYYCDAINRAVFDDPNYAYRFFNEMLQSLGVPSDQNDTTIVDGLNLRCDLSTLNQTLPANLQAFADKLNATSEYAMDYFDAALDRSVGEISDTVTSMINTYQNLFQQARIDLYVTGYSIFWNNTTHTDSVNVTTLHGNFYDPRWAISIPWIIIDFVSCMVLFLAALTSFYLKSQILAPDTFGYVFSLTRDNPNMHLPEVRSTLDGMTRARMLRQVRVQIADVRTTDDVGRIGLVRAEGIFNVEAARLRRDRHYV